jgi:hypothetical protein
MRDVTLELAAARKEVAAVAPPGAGAAPRAIGRIFAPSAGAAAQSSGPKKQSTRLRDIYLQQADEGLREVEERYREHARILEGVDRLRLEAMDEHSRSVVQLQDKYGELTAAVQAGAVEQQEAAQIAAGLAQQWSEHVQNRDGEHERVREGCGAKYANGVRGLPVRSVLGLAEEHGR